MFKATGPIGKVLLVKVVSEVAVYGAIMWLSDVFSLDILWRGLWLPGMKVLFIRDAREPRAQSVRADMDANLLTNHSGCKYRPLGSKTSSLRHKRARANGSPR